MDVLPTHAMLRMWFGFQSKRCHDGLSHDIEAIPSINNQLKILIPVVVAHLPTSEALDNIALLFGGR